MKLKLELAESKLQSKAVQNNYISAIDEDEIMQVELELAEGKPLQNNTIIPKDELNNVNVENPLSDDLATESEIISLTKELEIAKADYDALKHKLDTLDDEDQLEFHDEWMEVRASYFGLKRLLDQKLRSRSLPDEP
jgi:hypothetical protein